MTKNLYTIGKLRAGAVKQRFVCMLETGEYSRSNVEEMYASFPFGPELNDADRLGLTTLGVWGVLSLGHENLDEGSL